MSNGVKWTPVDASLPEPDQSMQAIVGQYRLGAMRQDFLNAKWVSVVDGPALVVANSASSREEAMRKAEQVMRQHQAVHW